MKLTATSTTCRVAVVQEPSVFLNLEASLERACALVERAANQGASLVTFPETWLPGYPIWLDVAPKAALWDYYPAKALYRVLAANSICIPGVCLDTLRSLAHRTGVDIVMGAHERAGGTLYNTMVFVHRDGRQFKIHRKLLPTYNERLIWGRGDGSTLSVLDCEYGRLGGLICWEHWMPLARAAMHAQHETIHVAQWPAGKALHQLASRHYAFEGQCYVILAAGLVSRGDILEGFHSLEPANPDAAELLEAIPGVDADLVLNGGSAIIGPDSHYVAGPLQDEAGILYGNLDLKRLAEGKLALDTHGHYARPDVFRLEVNTAPQASVIFKGGDPG